jgi:hypothetical protein
MSTLWKLLSLKTPTLTSHFLLPVLQLLGALWAHMRLVLRLKHHGHGLPNSMPSASLLVAAYLLCNLISAEVAGQLTSSSVLGLCLISYAYVFYLRNPVIGLLILISIITNCLALLLHWRFGTNHLCQQVLTAFEYLLITGAIVNVMTKETPTL